MAGNRNSGRRRKSAAQRHLHGSVTREHHRARPEPVYTVEAPDPPASLSGDAKKEWDRITPMLVEKRLIARVDLAVLAGYCTLFGMVEQGRREIQSPDFRTTYMKITVDGNGDEHEEPREHPALKSLRANMQLLRPYLTELGLTPATRAKVSPLEEAPEPPAKHLGQSIGSSFDALTSRMSGRGKVVPFGKDKK